MMRMTTNNSMRVNPRLRAIGFIEAACSAKVAEHPYTQL